MKKFTEVYKVTFSMLYGGMVTATVTKVTATEVTLTESWIAEDTMETVSEDTVYEKRVDDEGNEYIVIWEYYDHKGTVYGEEVKEDAEDTQVHDFRTVKDTVNRVVAELREQDPNWSWRAVVNKSEIKVFWGYLQYCDTKDSHFTIKMSDRPEESNTEDFMVARNERDEYMTGAIVGDQSWGDGNIEKCVETLLRAIAGTAHSCY